MTNLRDRLMQAVVTGSLTWLAFGTPALAGDLSQQQILDALTPHQMTRSLTAVEPTGPDHRALIENLRHRGTRSLTTTERTELAAMSDERPAIDLQIYFDFDSAAVTPRAVPQLTNLGNALSKPELRDSLVTINGHTDAKGTDGYNQKLSEQRAETIKQTWSIISRCRRKTWSPSVTASRSRRMRRICSPRRIGESRSSTWRRRPKRNANRRNPDRCSPSVRDRRTPVTK
jgi:outer membrane protein OmpA-like peptidoglycan-associated protein